MMRILGFVFITVGIFGLSHYLINQKLPEWESRTIAVINEAREAELDVQAWDRVVAKADQELPWFYPFSKVKKVVREARTMVYRTHNFADTVNIGFSFEDRAINSEGLFDLFTFMSDQSASLDSIIDDIHSLPLSFLDEEKKVYVLSELAWLEYLDQQLKDAQTFEKIFKKFVKDEERVLVLLQNQNEPRSTGGFVGSLVLFDFKKDIINWRFLDIYELDRLVPPEAQTPAPPFFHGLSKTISLRDANFWPDFRTTASEYRYFFDVVGEEPPKTIVAINLNTIKEVVNLVGPIQLEKWDLELDSYNFDVVLQFLVESKITGRFAVKEPVEIFAAKLFSPEALSSLSWEALSTFDVDGFLSQKNILAHSQNVSLQKLFEKWRIDGQLRQKKEANNFLHFDFISIGANKSEKFMWTKLIHDSEILPSGTVNNTLKIRRTHALRPGELNDLLGTNKMSQNVRELIDETLWWKLGAGQNRTVLRVWVPREARLLSQNNPSGVIREMVIAGHDDFKVLEIPMNVLPSETLDISLVYETRIERGSSAWRPYFLELIGTPGKDKTEFLSTISTPQNSQFTAETQNIGLPVSLIDQDFRTVVEFKK